MKTIGMYRELYEHSDHEYASGLPKMSDNFSDEPVEHADEIVDFIANAGFVDIAAGSNSTDVFTGKGTGYRDCMRGDGTYRWAMSLAHYVKEYNLMLPEDFVAHVLSCSAKASDDKGGSDV